MTDKVTKEDLGRDFKRFADSNEPISQMKELIGAGRGEEHAEFVLSRGDEIKVVEGTAVEVYRKLVAHEKEWLAAEIERTAQVVEKLKWAFSDENRALVADTDPITSANEAERQAWLTKAAENAIATRDKMVLNQSEFNDELKRLDAQIDEIKSLITEPFTETHGAGKVRVLDEKRLARDPHTQIRYPPLRDQIAKQEAFREYVQRNALASPEFNDWAAGDPEAAKQFNAHTRELAETLTGKPLIKVVEEIMDATFPELMKAFYPRVYEHTGRYHSPRACAAMMANVVAESLRYGFHRAATAYKLLMPGLTYLRERRMPMFFIAPDLLEAVLRTDFDDDINWTELELPYESGILILPKGSLVHPEDGDVAMLIWSRVKKGDHKPPFPGLPTQTLGNDAFVILGACLEKMIWYDSILTANVRPTTRLNNLFYREPGQDAPRAIKSNFMDSDLTEQDSEFLEKMGVIVFGTILAMNARPLLVERGKLLKRVGKGDKAREFWSPNVIGARYKFKREPAKIVDRKFVQPYREHGWHASPRMHWRRGHYRNQAFGQGRKERKQIWIEPCLIGAETGETQ